VTTQLQLINIIIIITKHREIRLGLSTNNRTINLNIKVKMLKQAVVAFCEAGTIPDFV
jgi:hypothetical protein